MSGSAVWWWPKAATQRPLSSVQAVGTRGRSRQDGTVTACDALKIGRAAFALGAGREHASQDVHPGVGPTLHKKTASL